MDDSTTDSSTRRGRDDGGGTEVYADDDDGTLLASVTDPRSFTASCLECGWAAAAAAGDDRAFDPLYKASCAAEWCKRVASGDVKRRGNVKRRRREQECEASAPRTGRRPRAGPRRASRSRATRRPAPRLRSPEHGATELVGPAAATGTGSDVAANGASASGTPRPDVGRQRARVAPGALRPPRPCQERRPAPRGR